MTITAILSLVYKLSATFVLLVMILIFVVIDFISAPSYRLPSNYQCRIANQTSITEVSWFFFFYMCHLLSTLADSQEKEIKKRVQQGWDRFAQTAYQPLCQSVTFMGPVRTYWTLPHNRGLSGLCCCGIALIHHLPNAPQWSRIEGKAVLFWLLCFSLPFLKDKRKQLKKALS